MHKKTEAWDQKLCFQMRTLEVLNEIENKYSWIHKCFYFINRKTEQKSPKSLKPQVISACYTVKGCQREIQGLLELLFQHSVHFTWFICQRTPTTCVCTTSLRVDLGDPAQTPHIFSHCLCPSSWESTLLEEFIPLVSPGPTHRRERAGAVCLLKLHCVSKICPPKMLINSISLWWLSAKTLLPSGKNPLSLNLQPNVSELLKEFYFPILCPFCKQASFLYWCIHWMTILRGSIMSLTVLEAIEICL